MFAQSLSGYISERAKYLEYREQADRVVVDGQRAVFKGKNDNHHLFRQPSGWLCDCRTYPTLGWCSHSEAMNWMECHHLWGQYEMQIPSKP